MKLFNSKELLELSQEKDWALPHFNVHNPLLVRGVIRAAEETKTPVILAIGYQSIKHAGLAPLTEYIKTCVAESSGYFALHMDHAKDLDIIKEVIDLGFSSVMLDASHYSLEDNISMTNEVIALARPKNISVEAEIGIVPAPGAGNEDIFYTDPNQAKEFYEKTNVDFLAVSLGSIHGMTMASQSLNCELLKDLKDIAPLVLHGASGVTYDAMADVAKNGIRKININTALKVAATEEIHKVYAENPSTDLLEVMDRASQAVCEKAKEYMMYLNALEKAK